MSEENAANATLAVGNEVAPGVAAPPMVHALDVYRNGTAICGAALDGESYWALMLDTVTCSTCLSRWSEAKKRPPPAMRVWGGEMSLRELFGLVCILSLIGLSLAGVILWRQTRIEAQLEELQTACNGGTYAVEAQSLHERRGYTRLLSLRRVDASMEEAEALVRGAEER